MHSYPSLAFLALLISLAAAAPAFIAKESTKHYHKIQRVETGKYRKHAPTEMAKARQKYAKYTNTSSESQPLISRDYHEVEAADMGELYTIPLTIGTPGQSLNMDLDTGSNDLWVFSDFLSSDYTSNHNIYSPDQSSTSSALSGETFSMEYADSTWASGPVYTDTVIFAAIDLTNQAIECANSISDVLVERASDGIIGMGFSSTTGGITPIPWPTWISNILGHLDQQIFTAALKYDAPGWYTFGDIDPSQYSGSIAYTPVVEGTVFWEIDIGVNGVDGTTTAIVDTGTTLIAMSDDICAAYYANVPGAVETGGQWVYPSSSIAALPGFSILVSGTWITTDGAYMNFAYSYTDDYGTDWYSGAVQSNGGGLNVLGDYFLSSVFAVFDYGNSQVGFAAQA